MMLLDRLLPLALAWVGLRVTQGFEADVSSLSSSESIPLFSRFAPVSRIIHYTTNPA